MRPGEHLVLARSPTQMLLNYYYYYLVLYLRPGEHLVERDLAVAVAVELAEDRADALLGCL